MDVGAIHSLVRDLNFDTFGVTVTVQPVDGPTFDTVGIWVTPITDGFPQSFRQGPRLMEAVKILALKAADAALVNRDARIVAPDGPGGVSANWKVEGPDEIFSDHTRFKVIRDSGAC